MKKVIFLLVSLLSFVTSEALAQIEAGTTVDNAPTYLIKHNSTDRYAWIEDGKTRLQLATEIADDNEAGHWKFIETTTVIDDVEVTGYYIYNVAKGQYLKEVASLELEDEPTKAWYIGYWTYAGESGYYISRTYPHSAASCWCYQLEHSVYYIGYYSLDRTCLFSFTKIAEAEPEDPVVDEPVEAGTTIDEAPTYVLKNNSSKTYAWVVDGAYQLRLNKTPSDNTCQWKFIKSENAGAYYLYNVGMGQYLKEISPITFSEEPEDLWYVGTWEYKGESGAYISDTEDARLCWAYQYDSTRGYYVGHFALDRSVLMTFTKWSDIVTETEEQLPTVLSLGDTFEEEHFSAHFTGKYLEEIYEEAGNNYYRFRRINYDDKGTLGVNASQNPDGVDYSASDINQIWQMVPYASDGVVGFKFLNSNYAAADKNAYLYTVRDYQTEFQNSDNAGIYGITDINLASDYCKINLPYAASLDATKEGWRMTINAEGAIGANETPDHINTLFRIEKVESFPIATNTLGDVTWASGYMPFGVSLPEDSEGVTLYVAKSKDAEQNTMTLQSATSVAAKNGFVVKTTAVGDDAAATTVTLNINTDATNESILTGTTVKKTVNDSELSSVYVFSKNANNKVGFYTFASASTIGANKAYFKAEGGSAQGFSFFFDEDDTTAITTVPAATAADGAIYDLSGRRLSAAPAHGIYIMGGKKFVK